jgi:hypothetical protein
MTTVKRFWNVRRPGGVVHRMFSKTLVEGNLTQCGIRVQKGWMYWTGGMFPGHQDSPHVFDRCKRCGN